MKKPFLFFALFIFMASAHGLIGYGESNIFSITDETLPVELSSFTAAINAQNNVSLCWTSKSETGLLGYRIFRSESGELENSILITALIPATNTSTTQNYLYEDREVEFSHTYHYWLECVDYESSEYFGPVCVTLEENFVPPMPEVTLMSPAYPNPFDAITRFDVNVKAGETACLKIYNLAGQVVRSHDLVSGNHKMNWDGRDSHNRPCASGVYLVRLKSQSCVKTAKLLLVKSRRGK